MTFSMFQINRRGRGLSIWKVLFWWTFVLFLMRMFHVVLYRYRRHGVENVPRNGSFIIVCNHQSNYDPSLVGSLAGDRIFKGIARETLFTSKVLSFFLHRFGTVSIKRGESDTAAIRSILKELAAGRGVLLFPEGTRCQDGQIGPFKRGFWLMMKKSKANILPVAIEGAFDVWPIGSTPKWRGWIETAAGEPIKAERLLEMGEEVGTAFIRDRIETLRRERRASIIRRSKQ